MNIIYDRETDSMSIEFQEGEYEVSNEIAEGIIIDYTKDGRVLAIEILNASKRIPKESLEAILVKTMQMA